MLHETDRQIDTTPWQVSSSMCNMEQKDMGPVLYRIPLDLATVIKSLILI